MRFIPWRRQVCSELAEAAFVRTRSHFNRFDKYVFLRKCGSQLKAKPMFVRTRSCSERFRAHVYESFPGAARYVASWPRQRSCVPARILKASTSMCACEGLRFNLKPKQCLCVPACTLSASVPTCACANDTLAQPAM